MRIVRLFHKPEIDQTVMEQINAPCEDVRVEGMTDSVPVPAESFILREVTIPNETANCHQSPAVQLVIALDGGMRIASSSGDVYDLQPGELLLVEDVTGPGHRTWNYEGRRLHVRIPAGVDVLALLGATRSPLNA